LTRLIKILTYLLVVTVKRQRIKYNIRCNCIQL